MSNKKGVIVAGKDARKRSRNEKPGRSDRRVATDAVQKSTKASVKKAGKIVAGD